MLVVLGLLHDGLENLEVLGEGLSALIGQGVEGATFHFGVFVSRDVTLVCKGAEVRDEVAVTHLEVGLKILETPLHTAGEERHDRQAPFLVDGLIDLGEVDHDRVLDIFQALAISKDSEAIDEMKATKGEPHDGGPEALGRDRGDGSGPSPVGGKEQASYHSERKAEHAEGARTESVGGQEGKSVEGRPCQGRRGEVLLRTQSESKP